MPLQKGDHIGAYQIVAPMGQGGMATVYKAYHPRLNRFVAIKMIHPAYLGDETFLTRFEREAQIVAALEHPNIVPVYDFSEHEGEPYLVMKLIEGSTLKAVLHDDAIPVDDILTIMEPIAHALDYAHSRGVFHRDIKPSNIILDRQMTPYLTDFGLARLSISGATTLSTDMMIGTPYYMSPEQAAGRGAVDHRADLYSLGVVFYELFVGQVPFSEGTPYAIISDHIASDLPLPHDLNPDVPLEVEITLLRALSKDPDDRYQSAATLFDAVRDAVAASEQQITRLSAGRQSAAISLAQSIKPATTTHEGKPTPVAATTPPASPQRGSRWIAEMALIVIGIVVIIALAAFALTRQPDQTEPTVPTLAILAAEPSATPVLVAANPILDPTSTFPPTWTSAPAVTAAPPATLPPPTLVQPLQPPINAEGSPLPPQSMPMIPMPDMGLAEAQAAIDQGNEFIGNYLALYRAQLQEGDLAAAGRTLAEGVNHAPVIDAYWMTAAELAVQAGANNLAFLCYSNALSAAEGERAYESVRWTAGEYLYRAATQIDRLTLAEIRGLSQELAQNDSPIVNAMIGRAFLTNGNDRLAEVSIVKALTLDNTLAETHLVFGELLQAKNDRERARQEWQIALDKPSVPVWVHDRATELLSTLN